MSQYSREVNGARGGTASVVSVGDSIDRGQVYNSTHPLYKAYTEQLQERIAEIVARESEKAAKAQQAVCTVALEMESKSEVVREYPELRVVWPLWRVPVHPAWVARRELVNQYMVHHVRSYADSLVHYGGGALAALTYGNDQVQLRTDTASAVAVHEAFEDDVLAAKLCALAASASTVLGWNTDPAHLRRYAAGEVLRKESALAPCVKKVDAMVVDGTVSFIPPLQFAAAMVQHGADIGMFAFPYHPSMLVHGSGELYGTGVYYELDEHAVRLKYPESVAGVTTMDATAWHGWLANTERSLAGLPGFSFQYELMGSRGPFMLVRVVKNAVPAAVGAKLVHSLQLQGMEDLTLVKTWRLKNLAVDPYRDASWEPVEITVPTRVVEKTHDYAMSLGAEQFSRHAIRKRLTVVNDRVVIQGTSVVVNDALTSEHLDHLETAIFTHCFVARYESNRLANSLRKVIDQVAGFGALGFGARLMSVIVACASLAYDWTLAAVDQRLRDVFDAVRRWWDRDGTQHRADFALAPTFVRYETLVGSQAVGIVSSLLRLENGTYPVASSVPTMPGFSYSAVLGAIVERDVGSVPVFDSNVNLVRGRSHLFADVVDTSGAGAATDTADALMGVLRENNEFDEPGASRHFLNVVGHESGLHEGNSVRDDYQYDPGFSQTLDDFHESVFPGIRGVDFKYDPTTISTDSQDRSLAAEYLALPLHFGDMPRTMKVYSSKLQAYNVTKRPITVQESLSAFHARNLSAPVLAAPQHDEELIAEVWDDFLDIACLPDAREKLRQYQEDQVGLEEAAARDWMGKARPENLVKVFKYFVENPYAWEELRIARYDSMPKTDVKVPLSDKPLHSRVEPQVIVHHLPAINAVFSSVFRVLVRRFLSLLKPNIMVNLLKDMPEVRDMMQAHHDWSTPLKFLENDFSKYDKSQGRFIHMLEQFVFGQLGMNKRMLEAWGLGHVDCDIRSVATAISLSVRYQRKSGDATTSFANTMVNILTVIHAYKGTDIVWAVFLGDDSLIAARVVCASDVAVRILAEKFNLQAKFYITDTPYFASNFILVNQEERRIVAVPDPLKRVEKWSMAVTAVEPKWEERYISAENTLKVYRDRANLVGLREALYTRYGSAGRIEFGQIGDALASAVRSFSDFRSLWEERPMDVVF